MVRNRRRQGGRGHGHATMTMIQALRSAMDVMLARDPDVVVFGQDVGYFGGVFRCTEGLQEKYGKSRVFDAPISEGGIVGTAVGMGAYGLRPVVEIQFADYIYPASDQIVSEAARLRYRSAGDFTAPITSACPAAAASSAARRTARARRRCSPMSAGLQDGDALQPLRRQGAADRRDRGRRSGRLPRAQAALQRPVRRPPRPAGGAVVEAPLGEVPEGHYTVPLGKARGLPRGRGRHGAGLRHDGAMSRWPRRRRPASTPRSSTCARSCRSTSTRSSTR